MRDFVRLFTFDMRMQTRLLGEWVRERKVLSLEQAVRKLTFESASTFGIHDRGMLRPGLAADIVLFDPKTVKPADETVVHDFPGGGDRNVETTTRQQVQCGRLFGQHDGMSVVVVEHQRADA